MELGWGGEVGLGCSGKKEEGPNIYLLMVPWIIKLNSHPTMPCLCMF